MKKINFKQPKYVLPLIALPFLCLLFYVGTSWGKGKKPTPEEEAKAKQNTEEINPSIPDPSKEVQNAEMKDKFEAYTDRFKKESDYSAVRSLDPTESNQRGIHSVYNDNEKRRIDSITAEIKSRQLRQRTGGGYSGSGYMPSVQTGGRNSAMSETDRKLAQAMSELNQRRMRSGDNGPSRPQEDDYSKQMRMFKQQMDYMDSLEKSRDPEYRANSKKKLKPAKIDTATVKPLAVTKTNSINPRVFNTIRAEKSDLFIKAIIDENVQGYAGSRIRIRLLDDIQVGQELLLKGTYLYGLIYGFQAQRVLISITSVMVDNKVLPISLKLYDNDGLEGLYVPASKFREFTKELGANGAQGIQYSSEGGNEIMTGLFTKLFTSTTTAAAQLIKKDKAKLKYNTIVYLVPKEDK